MTFLNLYRTTGTVRSKSYYHNHAVRWRVKDIFRFSRATENNTVLPDTNFFITKYIRTVRT